MTKRFLFPTRSAVEREIEAVENPKGMRLNDGKETVRLPVGTLRLMLTLIDEFAPATGAVPAKGLRMLTSDEIDKLVQASMLAGDSCRAIIKRTAYKTLEVNGGDSPPPNNEKPTPDEGGPFKLPKKQ